MSRSDHLVTPAWLAAHLHDPDIVAVDGSWHMPAAGRNPRAEYLSEHVPGAVFFDIDAIADTSSGLPHMLPAPEVFAAAVGGLGIGDDTRVVVYDSIGLMSAARVWWSFRAMGHRNVVILDGGLPAWKAAHLPLEGGAVQRPAAVFTPAFEPARVRNFDEVKAALGGDSQIIDARSAGRFAGTEPEPREGLASGHMPGAVSLPFGELVEGGRIKHSASLAMSFSARAIDLGRPVIASCGSGITAAVIAFALDILGAERVAVYDGSWTEWGSRPDAPVVQG